MRKIALIWFGKLRKWFRPRSLGEKGERLAERYLRRLGMKIVARGEWNAGAELDLVAVENRTIVFVEVKTRQSTQAGSPVEAVDQRKQQRILRAAASYIRRHDLQGYPTRFDVVGIHWPVDSGSPRVEHLRDAFTGSDG